MTPSLCTHVGGGPELIGCETVGKPRAVLDLGVLVTALAAIFPRPVVALVTL